RGGLAPPGRTNAAREASAACYGAGASALSAAVRERARALGFGLVGIAGPEPSARMAFYRRWLADRRHGGMAYLARPDAVTRRGDLSLTLPGVRSVVVVGHEYYQQDPPGVPDDPTRGVIARYARGRDYHKVVKKKLAALGRWLEGGWRASVDTGPILERELGQRAGLGWFGKNTMLINPRKGSYLFLGVLLTDVALEPDGPFTADFCGSCTQCLDACPTGALLGRDADGAPVLDATRCISYLTIEHRGEIPPELAECVGNRIYGCDICQEVCPWNRRFAEVAAERGYAAREAWEAEWDEEDVSAETRRGDEAGHGGGHDGDVSAETSDGGDATVTAGAGPDHALISTTDGPSLVALMRMSEDEWNAYTRGSAMRRAGYGGLRRNVAIALGNWLATSDTPDPDAVGELVAALSDEDEVVAQAAAWALRRVRGPQHG
ncbi:MAG: tRNA epoxyqueuosine(34) reductase QueG, partial [Gemmatimonadetes bacterium]|nr:tRNA epoxyqueuosine(34) reductase QueG [Gemmatimonadota bacterium]